MAYMRHQGAEIIQGNKGGHNLWDNLHKLMEVSQSMMKLLQKSHQGTANLIKSTEEQKQSIKEQKQSIKEQKQSIKNQKQSIKEFKDMLRVVGRVGCAIWLRFVGNYARRKVGQILFYGIGE